MRTHDHPDRFRDRVIAPPDPAGAASLKRPFLRPLTVLVAFLMSLAASIVFAQPSAAAVVDSGTLSAGAPVTGKVAVAGQDIQYSFAAAKDAHLTFTITATNWGTGSAYLRFYNPTGTASITCLLGTTPRACEITPNVTGTWKVKLDPTGDAVGSMTMVRR